MVDHVNSSQHGTYQRKSRIRNSEWKSLWHFQALSTTTVFSLILTRIHSVPSIDAFNYCCRVLKNKKKTEHAVELQILTFSTAQSDSLINIGVSVIDEHRLRKRKYCFKKSITGKYLIIRTHYRTESGRVRRSNWKCISHKRKLRQWTDNECFVDESTSTQPTTSTDVNGKTTARRRKKISTETLMT
jgi:hypothetical protein